MHTTTPGAIYGQTQRDMLTIAHGNGLHRAEAGDTSGPGRWHVIAVTVAADDLTYYALPEAGDWLHIVTDSGDDWAYGPLTVEAADEILELWDN